MIAHDLKKIIIEASHTAFPHVAVPDFALVHPENVAHGDYAANVALIMAKMVQMNPFEVAQRIAGAIEASDVIKKVEAVRPGFLNIHVSERFFSEELRRLLASPEKYGTAQAAKQEAILLEYGQPNTHKVAHVGHLYSYCYGESVARLLTAVGNRVVRANYQGDVGPHVAKCLWAYMKNAQSDPESSQARVAYLQQCYQEGSAAYETDEAIKKEIDTINRRIYERDPEIMSVWEKTRQWSLDAYREFEGRLGVHYDRYYLESEVYEVGQQIVRDHLGDIFEEDQGAVIFRGEQYGLHTRVFINSRGNPTYEAKDIGLITLKHKEFDFDKAIVEVGNDQLEYWRVVRQAIELLYPEIKGTLSTLHHGMINLTTGKMSSRTGNILTGFSLVEIVKAKVLENIPAERNYTPEQKEEIAEMVAIGAVKYSFLKSSPGKDITFDLETSIASEGNSGPYLQYAYARTQSLLRKAGLDATLSTESYEVNDAELTVLRWIARYEEVVCEAAAGFGPHTLASYLFELAQRYSYFYNEHQILSDDRQTSRFRLTLTAGVGHVLKSGLGLLGIPAPEQI